MKYLVRVGDADVDCMESCDEAADSCTANDPDASACDDGMTCNGADSCVAGSCSAHEGTCQAAGAGGATGQGGGRDPLRAGKADPGPGSLEVTLGRAKIRVGEQGPGDQ